MTSTSSTATELLPNPHPGEILAGEFMEPMGLSQNALARAVHVPPRRINELVHGRRAVTADTDREAATVSLWNWEAIAAVIIHRISELVI